MITFLRFSPIFGEKISVFLKNQYCDQIFAKSSSSLSKNANILAKIFGKNVIRIITSAPGRAEEKSQDLLSFIYFLITLPPSLNGFPILKQGCQMVYFR
jgi:hypothetical protein